MSFEIVVFENQSLYDGTREIEDEKEAVKRFLDYCDKYSSYEYAKLGLDCSDEKEERTLTIGNLYVSYADDSGGDKPFNIFLMGKLTKESKDLIINNFRR